MNQSVISSQGLGIPQPSAVVAIPVCNEAQRIGACLEALHRQIDLEPGTLGIVLFLNNCTDETAEVIRAFGNMFWPVRVFNVTNPHASAGWARRLAMDAAADWLSESDDARGIILTTDADSRVGPDWVSRNLAALSAGADAVAGRISLDPTDAALLPAHLHARGKAEAEYEALLTEISARADPHHGDPWPCHRTDSGATLSTSLAVYRQIGGMPDLSTGEDRAFAQAIRAADLCLRHPMDIEVITSGRLDGRAEGGVAETMMLRCKVPDSFCDDRLESVAHMIRRIFWRRVLRHLYERGQLGRTWTWAPALSISPEKAALVARERFLGAVIAAAEAASPKLVYKPLRPSQLARQIRYARLLLPLIRTVDRQPRDGTSRERRACAIDSNPMMFSRIP